MTNNPPEAVFIDNNIWLYALITGQDPAKSVRAKQVITAHTGTIAVSTQVINEVCVNLIKREKFTPAQVHGLMDDFYALHHVVELNHTILVQATNLLDQFSLSYWDSLIVACALASRATRLLSEDMQHGLVIDHLTIENPLASPPQT